MDEIFNPHSGERGYFVTEREMVFIKAIISDFKVNRLSSVEVLLVGADADD